MRVQQNHSNMHNLCHNHHKDIFTMTTVHTDDYRVDDDDNDDGCDCSDKIFQTHAGSSAHFFLKSSSSS